MTKQTDMNNIFELKDVKPVPDIVKVYSETVKETQVPLIIDNGAFM